MGRRSCRRRHRAALGTVRRADPRSGVDRRGAARRQRGTTLLLLAYAAGAATSLALALLLGGKVFTAMKRSLGAGEWIRRGLGAAMLAGVAAIALGLDTGILARVSTASPAAWNSRCLPPRRAPQPDSNVDAGRRDDGANPRSRRGRREHAGSGAMMMAAKNATSSLPVEGQMPSLEGAVQWLNSAPLTAEQLKGKVVLVDFWTYSCINCLRTLPYVKAWADKYRDQGLVVIGVHAPSSRSNAT